MIAKSFNLLLMNAHLQFYEFFFAILQPRQLHFIEEFFRVG